MGVGAGGQRGEMPITFKRGGGGGAKLCFRIIFFFILENKYKLHHIRQNLSLNQEVKGWS